MHSIPIYLIGFYLTISFGYSVYEKLVDWKGSLHFYKNHFKNTFIGKHIAFWMLLVVLFELIGLILLLSGLIRLFILNDFNIIRLGFIAVAITLTGLMAGQRVAKDYPGAMNITVYFLLSVFGLYLAA